MQAFDEYKKRRERWHASRSKLEVLFLRIGNVRLVLGIAEAILAYLVFGSRSISVWMLLPLLVAFVIVAVWHARVIRRKTLAERALGYYDRNLERLENLWTSNPSAGERFRDGAHVYAEDLDLFGKGSLFQLLSTARTAAGEAMLAEWLLHAATADEARGRQQAVRELSTRLDLREDLALLGSDLRSQFTSDLRSRLNLDEMVRWGTAPAIVFAPILRWIAAMLAVLSLLSLYGFFTQQAALWQLCLVWGLDALVIYILKRRVEKVLAAAEAPGHGLPIFAEILSRLEGEQFTSSYLQRIRNELNVQGKPASARVKSLGRWMDWMDSGDHAMVRALRPLILWRQQIAMGIENWRRESGGQIGRWLRAAAEFEALSSFAALAFERPQWCYPEFVEGRVFQAVALQHPLLPPERCVPNDVALNDDARLLIVSGSNMSGKSTLLRGIGLNTVLAWAGAPVAAACLRISPLQTGASIRVSDSLMDNKSRFFAEISRLRQIVDLVGEGCPVLFLFDELLSGTNSHDRRIGAAAIVTRLVREGAIGLITTHDLALAGIQEDLGSVAANVHFDDHIVDGRIEFNYRLQPGVVTRSNALELMRAVGLEV